MASFNDTVDLERAFLRAITSSVIMARMYLHMANEDIFTSDERKFIFDIAEIALNESNSMLSRAVFEYEMGKRLEESISTSFIGEWNMIEGVETFDAPELILAKLKEAVVGRKALSVSEDIIEMLSKGRIKE